jgi:hypothetical protein
MSLFREQKNLMDQLAKLQMKLSYSELTEYKMFVKRQKDDEEFDTLSMKRLRELVAKYEVKRDKSAFDNLFKPKQDQNNEENDK